MLAVLEGYALPDGFTFIGVVYPDGDGLITVAFKTFERVSDWIGQMKPRELRVLVEDDENEGKLRHALADIGLAGARLN